MNTAPATGRRLRLALNLLAALVLLGVPVWLAAVLANSADSVKWRNALLAEVGEPDDFGWAPAATPVDFKRESAAVPTPLADAVAPALVADAGVDGPNLTRALMLAATLASAPKHQGGAIMRDTATAYRAIVNEGRGYCADFTQVFNALNYAAAVPVREWGIAFDGFGAGHAINEVYSDKWRKWVFIDSFNSFWMRDAASGEPLSMQQFMRRLREGADDADARTLGISVVPIVARRFPYKSDRAVLDYFRRGEQEYFLWWGNNALSYDSSASSRLLGGVSRALEQAGNIALGVHPRIRLYPTAGNVEAIDQVLARRRSLLLAFGVLMIAGVWLVAQGWRIWRQRPTRQPAA